jgi:glycosyltransferase involved in cell wall biosynthesis
MRQFVAENALANVTLELTAVANEDLRALYSTAALLLFPSLEEGFGWPIVEAQACGCPVATSKRSPMNEVAGEAAIYLDPEDPSSAAATLKNALDRLEGIREASLRNASRFKSGMIDGYIALYEKVCSAKHSVYRVN